MIDFGNSFNSKEISENENSAKIISIVEKTLDFNKQQKGKGIKILTPKEMLQRISVALVQIKAANTSQSLLNEIGQIIYSLRRVKQLTKNIYNNIMNSVKL